MQSGNPKLSLGESTVTDDSLGINRRYFVRSFCGSAISAYNTRETAEYVAIEFGDGAIVVDTLAQAYSPMAQVVAFGKLQFAGVGGWDTGRFELERDLVEAIKKSHVGIVHAFLAKGADANACDHNGDPALHWAAARGRLEIVTLLLEHDADPTAIDNIGSTALDLARTRGKPEVIEHLENYCRSSVNI